MEIAKKEILKPAYLEKLMPVASFAKTKKVANQAMIYAMAKGLVDWVEIAPRNRFIVLTQKSMDYTPNSSPNRARMKLYKEK